MWLNTPTTTQKKASPNDVQPRSGSRQQARGLDYQAGVQLYGTDDKPGYQPLAQDVGGSTRKVAPKTQTKRVPTPDRHPVVDLNKERRGWSLGGKPGSAREPVSSLQLPDKMAAAYGSAAAPKPLPNLGPFPGRQHVAGEVSTFHSAYNRWVIPTALYVQARGRVKGLENTTQLPNDPLLLDAKLIRRLERAARSGSPHVVNALANISRTSDVTVAAATLARVLVALDAAKAELLAVDMELKSARLRLVAMPQAQGALARIEESIQTITSVVSVVEDLVGTIASVVAERADPAKIVAQIAKSKLISRLTGFVARKGYQSKILRLKSRLTKLGAQAVGLDLGAIGKRLDAAGSHLAAARIDVGAKVAELFHRVESKRASYQTAGRQMDLATGRRPKGSLGPLEGLMAMASAAREVGVFADQSWSLGDPALGAAVALTSAKIDADKRTASKLCGLTGGVLLLPSFSLPASVQQAGRTVRAWTCTDKSTQGHEQQRWVLRAKRWEQLIKRISAGDRTY